MFSYNIFFYSTVVLRSFLIVPNIHGESGQDSIHIFFSRKIYESSLFFRAHIFSRMSLKVICKKYELVRNLQKSLRFTPSLFSLSMKGSGKTSWYKAGVSKVGSRVPLGPQSGA